MNAANDGNDGAKGGNTAGDVGAADEQALVALFASLVQDAEPSGLSPLKVQELARNEARLATGQRERRFRITRNVLVAAVLAAAVVWVFPRLLPESGSSTTAGSSSASAATSAAAPVASVADAPPPAAATRAAAPSSAAAGSSGRVGGALGEGTDDRETSASAPGQGAGQVTSGSASAASSAAAASVPASGAASGSAGAGAAPTPVSSAMSSAAATPDAGSAAGGCRLLPGNAIAAVRAAFPAGYFGAATRVSTCGGYGAQLNAGSPEAVSVVVLVRKAPAGACRTSRSGVACPEEPVAAGVFRTMTAGGAPQIWVYGGGYEVFLSVAGRFPPKVEPDRLVAAGRRVIEALG